MSGIAEPGHARINDGPERGVGHPTLRTNANIAAFIAGGNTGQAATTAARSGSPSASAPLCEPPVRKTIEFPRGFAVGSIPIRSSGDSKCGVLPLALQPGRQVV